MTKLDLGPIGATLDPDEGGRFIEVAVAAEDLGYTALWVTGGPLASLGQITDLLRATRTVKVATGILSIDRFTAAQVQDLYDELETDHPGRFIVGLGGAHSGRPIPRLTAFIDELLVPQDRIALAALGPKMLDLARERTGGAYPVLVTPDYVTQARARLGPDTTLAIDQLVVVDADPESARATARIPLGMLGTFPQYVRNFQQMGFRDEDIEAIADPLVDGLVAWGGAEGVAARVTSVRRAGADHVAVSPVAQKPEDAIAAYEALAKHLL
jgi:probable F420-dependent oxidoreductase